MKVFLLVSGAIAAVLLFADNWAFARKWSDVTGKYTVEAELVTVKDANVVLQKSDKSTLVVPLEKLSDADREYLASLSGSIPIAASSKAKDTTKPAAGASDRPKRKDVSTLRGTIQAKSVSLPGDVSSTTMTMFFLQVVRPDADGKYTSVSYNILLDDNKIAKQIKEIAAYVGMPQGPPKVMVTGVVSHKDHTIRGITSIVKLRQ